MLLWIAVFLVNIILDCEENSKSIFFLRKNALRGLLMYLFFIIKKKTYFGDDETVFLMNKIIRSELYQMEKWKCPPGDHCVLQSQCVSWVLSE